MFEIADLSPTLVPGRCTKPFSALNVGQVVEAKCRGLPRKRRFSGESRLSLPVLEP